MNDRVARLRRRSFEATPTLSTERAEIVTRFYRENEGRYPVPVMRALAFKELCDKKTIWIGEDELIVGERGPAPKAVPTFPELTCHTAEDLRTLDRRANTRYATDDDAVAVYESEVIPYWRGRSMRDRVFAHVSRRWLDAYEAGVFTEFMEQRAPGHTALDGLLYQRGLLEAKGQIAERVARLDWLDDPEATRKAEALRAMDVACDAAMRFAERHAELAEKMALDESDPERREELTHIAEVCRRVPAHAPRTFHEALQAYWFAHLGTITELNGWDAMNPGHLDQHLRPFYERDLADGTLDREGAKELLECLWVKFNNHPAPPKVGVTAEESGTYNDFTNINLGGLSRDGEDAVSDLSYLLLEVVDEIRLLQPQANVQISARTPDRFLKAACRVIRKGYGYPSVFNADTVITEQVWSGKSVEDAREGGTSGCIETGAFGKEAYFLTGYLNTPKILELALNDGVDPASGKRIGPPTGDPRSFASFEDLYDAFETQLCWLIEVKVEANQAIESMYARYAPAPFLSVLIQDCIENARDYNDGGARYNTSYIQCCGIGTTTDALSALRTHVFEGPFEMAKLLAALAEDFESQEPLRQLLVNRTPRFGNDDDRADDIMRRVYDSLFRAIDGRPNTRGGRYHLNMLSTTCHVYFGTRVGATPDGRRACSPISDGTSPAHGADRHGPTAVCKSLGKMDQVKSGGTLLNQRFLPQVLEGDTGIERLTDLIRTYFRLGGHHIQFNVVDTETLRDAQARPEEYRDLLVRVAGYSDYFVDIGRDLQEEIIARTAQESM
ncbi:MAG: glycyl radical protein [Gemmatimonadetes bacterium]|nr:glycyl radical protein [Gemmatimonadota bacterium]